MLRYIEVLTYIPAIGEVWVTFVDMLADVAPVVERVLARLGLKDWAAVQDLGEELAKNPVETLKAKLKKAVPKPGVAEVRLLASLLAPKVEPWLCEKA